MASSLSSDPPRARTAGVAAAVVMLAALGAGVIWKVSKGEDAESKDARPTQAKLPDSAAREARPARPRNPMAEAQAGLDAILELLREGKEVGRYPLGDPPESPQALAFIIRGLWKSGLQGEDMDDMLGYLLDVMSGAHPEETLALIAELTEFNGSESRFLPRSRWVMAGIAVNEPEKAADWLIQHPDFIYLPDSTDVVEALLANVGKQNPARAWELLAALPVPDRAAAIQAIAQGAWDDEGRAEMLAEMRRRTQAGGDASEAELWKTSILEGLGQGLTGSKTIHNDWAEMGNSEEIIAWLGDQGLSKEELETIAEGFRPGGTGLDMANWAKWLEAHAAPEQLPEKIGELVTSWTRDGRMQTVETWISRQDDGPAKDAATDAFILAALGKGDVGTARRIGEALPEGERRDQILEKIRAQQDAENQ